jgi:hypothetical protein
VRPADGPALPAVLAETAVAAVTTVAAVSVNAPATTAALRAMDMASPHPTKRAQI